MNLKIMTEEIDREKNQQIVRKENPSDREMFLDSNLAL